MVIINKLVPLLLGLISSFISNLLLFLLVFALNKDFQFSIRSVSLYTEQKRGSFLRLEDFCFINNYMEHCVVSDGAVDKRDVNRGREKSIHLGKLLSKIFLSIWLINECQRYIRKCHNKFRRREVPIQRMSFVPRISIARIDTCLLCEFLLGKVGLEYDISGFESYL